MLHDLYKLEDMFLTCMIKGEKAQTIYIYIYFCPAVKTQARSDTMLLYKTS